MELDQKQQKKGRRLWFHLHFWIGWIAAVPIALVCFSGAVLIFEQEIFRWEHKELFSLQESGERLSIQEVLDTYRSAEPRLVVHHLSLPASPRHFFSAYCTEIRPEGNQGGRVYLNPYTGELRRLSGGFSISETLIDIHRHLAAGKTGQQIVAISSLVLAVTCVFGLVLWWPMRGRTFWRAWKRGGALDWHNALGLVAIAPLIIMAFTGILFTWGRQIWPVLESMQDGPSQIEAPTLALSPAGERLAMDDIIDRVSEAVPGERITGIQPGNGMTSPIKMILDAGDNRLHLFMDPYTGEELLRIDGSGTGPVGWLRGNFGALHTFWPYSFFLRVLWGLLSLAGGVLVVTGIWATVKRWRRKRMAGEV